MTIEPLSTISTAQNMNQVPNSSSKVAEVEIEKAAEKKQQAAETPKVDNTTKVVENTKEKGEAANEENEEEQKQTNERIRAAVETFNRNHGNSEAIYGIHDGTNRVTIKLVDKESRAVIKELPPEKTLDMIVKVWEMAGLLVDERR